MSSIPPPPPSSQTQSSDNASSGGCLKKLLLGFIGLVIISGIGSALGGGGSDPEAESAEVETAESQGEDESDESENEAAESAAYVVPEDRSGGEGEPFWQTTFLIEIPAGAWEEGDQFACRALDDDFTVASENGPLNVVTTTIDLSPSAIVSGACHSRAALIVGDFENLGTAYTFSNGVIEGMISDQDLLSGQGLGGDGTLTLVSGDSSSVQGATAPEVCTDSSMNATFETLAPHTCEDVYKTAVAILLQHGWDSPPPQAGLFIQVISLCTLTSETTYEPESTHIPALGDALMGVMCDADRALLVPS